MQKISICGSGINGRNEEIIKRAEQIGKALAENGVIMLTGGGSGYPNAALRTALCSGGRAVCYSPAKSKEEHMEKYKFIHYENAEYVYTGLGIPGRNYPLVENSDKVIVIGGQAGTLNEFTVAMAFKKPVFVLKGSGGITNILPKILEICRKSNESVEFFSDAKELVSLINRQK